MHLIHTYIVVGSSRWLKGLVSKRQVKVSGQSCAKNTIYDASTCGISNDIAYPKAKHLKPSYVRLHNDTPQTVTSQIFLGTDLTQRIEEKGREEKRREDKHTRQTHTEGGRLCITKRWRPNGNVSHPSNRIETVTHIFIHRFTHSRQSQNSMTDNHPQTSSIWCKSKLP